MNTHKVVKNAAWIIGTQIVKALLGVLITVFTARYLGPSNYGLINYAASMVAFVSPIMYLGLNNILVQEIVNHPDNEGEILGTAMAVSLGSSLLCIAGIAAFTAITNAGETETLLVCMLYSILLTVQSLELIVYWFQAKLLSKYSSVISLCAYITVSGYKGILLATGKSIYWFAISNALDYMLIAGALLIIYYRLGSQPLRFSRNIARQLLCKSRFYIIPSMMVSIFSQTDRIMLKLMSGNTIAGYYSAAIECIGMTTFIFHAIISSYRPVIFDAKKTGQQDFENSMRNLYCIIIWFSLILCLMFTIFAGLIIGILYGEKFVDSVAIMRLAVWYTPFSYIGAVRAIWILAEDKHRYLWIINLSGAIANVILNFIMIPHIGAMGAALASLLTQFVTNVVMGYLIKPIRYNNHLMLQSLNPYLLKNMYREMHK